MLRGVTLLLAFLLAGEATAYALHLPLPGSVLGMVFLLVWLWQKGRVTDDLAQAVDGLLANMPLLFVPVGVGAMVYFDLFKSQWLLIVVAVIGCTLLTVATTAAVSGAMASFDKPLAPQDGKPAVTEPAAPDALACGHPEETDQTNAVMLPEGLSARPQYSPPNRTR